MSLTIFVQESLDKSPKRGSFLSCYDLVENHQDCPFSRPRPLWQALAFNLLL